MQRKFARRRITRYVGAAHGALEGVGVLKVRETVETVQGFGCRYRVTRRTWLLFGILPVMMQVQRERC